MNESFNGDDESLFWTFAFWIYYFFWTFAVWIYVDATRHLGNQQDSRHGPSRWQLLLEAVGVTRTAWSLGVGRLHIFLSILLAYYSLTNRDEDFSHRLCWSPMSRKHWP